MAVLLFTFRAGLNEVKIGALYAKEIKRELNQRMCYNMVWELSKLNQDG